MPKTTLSIEMSERERRNAGRAYTAATQGMVLLKNSNAALPLAREGSVALLGLGAVRTARGGTGSGDPFNGGLSGGGDIDVDQSPRYHIHILDAFETAGYEVVGAKALRAYAEGHDQAKAAGNANPMATFAYPDPELTDGEVAAMSAQCDTAVYVLTRNAGEGMDRHMTKQVQIPGAGRSPGAPPASATGAGSSTGAPSAHTTGETIELGDYLLSEREIDNLKLIKKHFKKTVLVLNVGGNIDMNPVLETDIDAVLLMGQAGQEGGRAVLDVLNGTVNPSGKLTSTWARQYADYPASATFADNDGNTDIEKYEEGIYVGYRYFDGFNITPIYPFGYGLSYTTFDIAFKDVSVEKGIVRIKLSVTNTGDCQGREVAQIYYKTPDKELEMPVQELAAFQKTKYLNPGESQTLTLAFPAAGLASFNEKSEAYVLFAGEYTFYAGASSRDTEAIFVLRNPKTIITNRVRIEYPLGGELNEISREGAKPYHLPESDGVPVIVLDPADIPEKDSRSPFHDETVITYSTDRSYTPVMPYEKVEYVDKQDIKLLDVVNGKATLEELVAQLSSEQLAALNCGTGWGVSDDKNPMVGGSSESVPGAAGETTHTLKEAFGIPSIVVADGPGGIRVAQTFEATDVRTGSKTTVHHYCTAWPVGTLLAQSFDRETWEIVGLWLAEELDQLGVTIVLGPGMNIIRDPLCGRNFEYFSEDPLLTGEAAAGITRGIQSIPGVGACIKHFAANNQETNRIRADSQVGQRALREIYLKGYEIAIRESQPMSIMTSYNQLNGVPTPFSYDLCTDIARGEWGFKGLIMTDWNGGAFTPARAMHAGNDLVMPGGDVRAMAIQLAFNTIMPVFDERGQVLMSNSPPFPLYNDSWHSFTVNANGEETVTAPIGVGHFAEVKDGQILVDGEPVYTKASGFMELMRDRENFKPLAAPADTSVASLSEDGRHIIYKGTLNREKTVCLGDLQRCAVHNLYVIMRSISMKKMYPEITLEKYK
jgi:beta-glucosidase